jgi:hypothetical protein
VSQRGYTGSDLHEVCKLAAMAPIREFVAEVMLAVLPPACPPPL